MRDTPDSPPDSLLQQLDRTPPLTPPATLWPRLQAGQRKAVARRRLLAASPLAVAAALLASLLLPGPAPEVAPAPAEVAVDPAEVRERIASLDRALQAAYESDASDDDVAPMWAARAQLLDRLPTTALN
jgi:hypothetical protein